MFKTTTAKRRVSNNHTNYNLSQDLDRIRSALGEATFDVKAKIGDMLAQSIENAKDISEVTQKKAALYVHKKPKRALGFAALLGVAIGYFLHR